MLTQRANVPSSSCGITTRGYERVMNDDLHGDVNVLEKGKVVILFVRLVPVNPFQYQVLCECVCNN